jgi:hypothetical protein
MTRSVPAPFALSLACLITSLGALGEPLRARQAVALPPARQDTTGRAARWREDLDSAVSGFLPRDRSFSADARERFTERVHAIRDSVDALTDPQIVVRLAEATALSGNAHTRLYLLRNRTALRRYPVRVWWFGRELRVVRAKPGYERLLGARVTRIGGVPVRVLAQRVRPLYAANASWARYMSAYTMTSPDVLIGLGVADGDGRVTIETHDEVGGGPRARVTLAPLPLARTDEPTEAWWDLSPLHPGRDGPWTSALAADSARLPRYLRAPTRNYWYEWQPATRTMYVQYNRSQNEPGSPFGETAAAFGERLLRDVARRDPRRLVVDLRFNTGGNLQLADSMFRAIAALPMSQERGRLFVITGRATFSAGVTHVAMLRQLTKAVLVGERPGEGLDFWAEGGNYVLPNSRLSMHYANGFHSYSTVEHPEFAPYAFDLSVSADDRLTMDRVVEPTWAQYRARRDPAMEAVAGWGRR